MVAVSFVQDVLQKLEGMLHGAFLRRKADNDDRHRQTTYPSMCHTQQRKKQNVREETYREEGTKIQSGLMGGRLRGEMWKTWICKQCLVKSPNSRSLWIMLVTRLAATGEAV